MFTDILDAAKMLHKPQSMGSDSIPTFIAQDCATFWAEPLCKIMNKCLSDGIFPTQWKNTRIVPVFKNGNAALVENYRPISIIPVFAKIFEIILHKKLYYEFKPKISHMQHGFIQNKSTTSNLLILTQQISKNLNSNIQTDVIYTDFKKAFDSVDHNILLKKLANIGCSVKLVQLFHSYLQERKLSVQYRGQISKEFVATSGVPQGANLAALLFSVYVNDLAHELKTGALLYADDMKIYRNIRNKGDAEKLQMQLDKIATWCKYNGIQLNVKKCSVLTYSRACSPYIYNY
jgi:Reverse transcriptase (RNA-dependent DNA polymerase).